VITLIADSYWLPLRKGVAMQKAEITLTFDLHNIRDKRIHDGIMNLTKYFDGNLSEAFMQFFDRMVYTISECETRMQKCENLLIQVADQSVEKKEGHA
jgi:hypothetical protein